jgi:uncharacterized repeat protein (TIGR04076 family)
MPNAHSIDFSTPYLLSIRFKDFTSESEEQRRSIMADQPEGIKSLDAEIIGVKGDCSAGHKVGDKFQIGCWDTGGLCGFFYHDLFPTLSVMQFGGNYPWGSADEVTWECPDRDNAVTIRLRRA